MPQRVADGGLPSIGAARAISWCPRRAGRSAGSGESAGGRRAFPSRVEVVFDGGSVSKSRASMAESTSVALAAAPIPTSAEIARAEKLVRERFLHDGEDPAVALARGHAAAARAGPGAGRARGGPQGQHPSTAWRREFSLLLGLERRALRGGAQARRRHRPLRPPGRRSVGHAHGAARRGPAHGAAAATAAAASASPELLASADILGPDEAEQRAGGAAPPTPGEAEADDEEDEERARGRRRGRGRRGRRRARPVAARRARGGRGRRGRGRRGASSRTTTPRRRRSPRRRPKPTRSRATGSTRRTRRQLAEQPEDPNAAKRFWFEHATGAGKTVAALGFVEASQTGGVLILTHRRNLVDQFNGELRDRGYSKRISRPLLKGEDSVKGPVTVETYQWFVRNAGKISSAYTIVICDEAHTALGEKTSAAIRDWTGPIFIGMTATGALIARHVTDLFPTQTSRFDLAQAARRGVISPLRCVRISPGVGRAHDRQGAAAPRRGRHRVRPGRARQTARPAALQPGRRQPLQDPLQRRARRRLRGRRAPRLQPRRGLPRRET